MSVVSTIEPASKRATETADQADENRKLSAIDPVLLVR